MRFGTVAGNDNADFDHSTGIMTINRNLPGQIAKTKTGGAFRAKAAAATTIAHEFEHSRQSYVAWHVSVAKQRWGSGNPCERDAWGRGFNEMAIWIRHKTQEMDALVKENKPAHEQARAARELMSLCEIWGVYANDYDGIQGTIGDIEVADPTDFVQDGLPKEKVRPGDLRAKVEDLRKRAIGVMRGAGVLADLFDGDYTGKFEGDKIKGTIRLKIAGPEVKGRIDGTTTTGTIKSSVEGEIDFDGKLDLHFCDGTIGIVINKTEPFEYPFLGEATGNLSQGKVINGKWSTHSPKTEGIVGPLFLDSGTWNVEIR